MQPIIKWPGGKSEEIKEISDIIPNYDRYVEPFVGGGAVFFYLPNTKAIINDISINLVHLYELIKEANISFKTYLLLLDNSWNYLQILVKEKMEDLVVLYSSFSNNSINEVQLKEKLDCIEDGIFELLISKYKLENAVLLKNEFHRTVFDKVRRTVKNEIKLGQKLSTADLCDNILTGFTGGFYMFIRDLHNDCEKNKNENTPYRTALFYFVREFCYGSMFRYNSKGEFNIPYGGIAYNNKDFKKKIDGLFNNEISEKFADTTIMCGDFIKVFDILKEDDFMFVDPPYDTEFSDYEGRAFIKNDQVRLRDALAKTKAKFILIIKNTDFILSLYQGHNFKIRSFDKNYAYCVKNRNNRAVDHLIITNY